MEALMRGLAASAPLLLLVIAVLTLSCNLDSRSPATHGGATVETEASPPPRWSMAKWREAREEAEAATNAPMGEKRIRRCEAFLEKYPDYPERETVVRQLVDAYLVKDKGKLDFTRLDGLLQQMADGSTGYYRPQILLDSYYFENDFPPEMAERMAARNREALALDRKSIAFESDPRRRRELERSMQAREVSASIAEGRILLAKRDYAGAIRELRAAEAADAQAGSVSLTLVDSQGGVAATLPNGTPFSDRLNLALATSYARTGKREEAIARLDHTRGFLESFYPDINDGVEALRKELAMPSTEARVVRSDPKLSGDFRFKDLQGREVALSDFRGRVVLTMFWSTW